MLSKGGREEGRRAGPSNCLSGKALTGRGKERTWMGTLWMVVRRENIPFTAQQCYACNQNDVPSLAEEMAGMSHD